MQLFRVYTIVATVLRYGLDDLVPQRFVPWYIRLLRVTFFWLRNQHKDASPGERLRLALQSLGPVSVKFGQMLSTRRDLLPPDIANELTKLQDKVAPFDGAIAHKIVKDALAIQDLNEVFADFSPEPLASASIAQVHTATLKEANEAVVIKVIRPNIENTIHADIELMRSLAWLVQKALPDGRRLRPVEVVEEYKKTIFDELDLLRESANGVKLRENFQTSELLYIPKIYTDYCRKNVLVMERISGIPVADIAQLEAKNTNIKLLAERGVSVFFTQVFRDSFFHADMHPGNIFVADRHLDSPQYIAIDFGIVGTLNREDKRYLAENFIAFFNSDYRKVAELHVDSGWVPSYINVDEFEQAIRTVCEPIFHKPLAEISFGNVLMQLFNTARRFDMEVQPQLVLLQKTLLYVEGLGRQLYPQLDLWETAKPFLEDWMREQVGFTAMFNKAKANIPFWTEKFPEVPDLVFDTLKQVKQLPERHQYWHEQQLLHRRESTKSIVYGVSGASFVIIAAILPLYQLPTWSIVLCAGLGFGCWLKAFIKLYRI